MWGSSTGWLPTLAQFANIPNDDKLSFLREHHELRDAAVIEHALHTAQINRATKDFGRQFRYAAAAFVIAADMHLVALTIQACEECAEAMIALGNVAVAEEYRSSAQAIREGRLSPG